MDYEPRAYPNGRESEAIPFPPTRQASMQYGARHKRKQKQLGAYRMSGRSSPSPPSGQLVLDRVPQQVIVRQKLQGEVTAQRKVAAAAVATDAGDLDCALIKVDVVALVSVGRGIGSRHRNVDGGVDRNVDVDETPASHKPSRQFR